MVTATKATPAEYITITDAARRFAPEDTDEARRLMRYKIQNLDTRGWLKDTQKVRGPGKGGQVLVSVDEVGALLNNPPKRGPRPKSV